MTALSRRIALAACALGLGLPAARARGDEPEARRIVVFADLDDDDDDGTTDGVESRLDGAAAADVHWLGRESQGGPPGARILSAAARWVVGDRPLPSGAALPAGAQRVGLQGLAAGRTPVIAFGSSLDVSVVELGAYDAHGRRVDPTSSHASISRVLPAFLADDTAGAGDEDALRWIAVGDEASLPARVDVRSLRPDGAELDALSGVELWEMACPQRVAEGMACRGTPLIRATGDPIDRAHPESSGRSLLAEVGGRLVLTVGGRKAASIRVGGPRHTAVGPITRFRARLRVHVLRVAPGGAPVVGGGDAEAVSLVRAEVDAASLLWGQCGVHFGVGAEVPVKLVAPPPRHLVAVGCSLGQPASGGEIRLRVGAQPVRVPTHAGESPALVGERLAEALRAAGFGATLSPNPRIAAGALATADVLVRTAGAPANLERDGDAPLSSDRTLDACLGEVDLSDGLSHFVDHDAPAGTLEERTLIKAYADADPTTIEVFVVSAFASLGRVGESFIETPSASIRNTIVVDRAAIRAGARSHVLSHELGHVLLDMPGHPDDYGVDRPSALMDADATDPSIFGPRRLSVEECERTFRQRGPQAPAPLLEPWPWVGAGR